MSADRLVSLDAIFSSRFSPWVFRADLDLRGGCCAWQVALDGRRTWASIPGQGWIDPRWWCIVSMLFAPLEAHRVRVCEQGFRRQILAAGLLQELLRRNDGSSEGVAWTAVLHGSGGQANAVILYIFAHTRLLGPRKARPARASPPRPRARKSRSSRTTLAHAHAKGATTGEKGVQDDCGEGHKALSGQASTAGHGLERSGVLVGTPLGAHCCTSESPTRDSCAPSARSATPRSLPT